MVLGGRRGRIKFLGTEFEPMEFATFVLGMVLFTLGVVLMLFFDGPKASGITLLLPIVGTFLTAGQCMIATTKGFMVSEVVSRLDGHTKILNKHTIILNEHTMILNKHTEMLGEHTKLLSEIATTLGEVRDILRGRSGGKAR